WAGGPSRTPTRKTARAHWTTPIGRYININVFLLNIPGFIRGIDHGAEQPHTRSPRAVRRRARPRLAPAHGQRLPRRGEGAGDRRGPGRGGRGAGGLDDLRRLVRAARRGHGGGGAGRGARAAAGGP